MKLKEFQYNYTTPEQAKRLVKLGLPKNSADCYYNLGFERLTWIRRMSNEMREDFFDDRLNRVKVHFPIWSASRLIEIFCLMTGLESCRIAYKHNMIDSLIFAIKDNIGMGFNNLYEDEKVQSFEMVKKEI